MGSAAPYLGLIEGFYGQRYSEKERAFLYKFLQGCGYSFYIYAPKEDEHLRDKWQQDLDQPYLDFLKRQATRAHQAKLEFGVALSPMNLTANFASQQDLLLERITTLCATTQCEIFALLFDDMVKDAEDVGAKQHEVIAFVEQHLPEQVKHFIICPSYYTDDPVLDKLFGQRPANYFKELMADMPERVEVFWTGPKVLSDDITPEHIENVTKLLGRKPFIWDNYPVNDGKNICSYVYLGKFKGRRGLNGLVTGHAVNPMVQPLLSTLAEVTLPLIYQDKSNEEINAAHLKQAKELFGLAMAMIIKADNQRLLTTVGLKNMSPTDRQRLLEFCQIANKPALKELEDFLNGSKRFDQAIVSGTHFLSQG